ncbi:MAG: hypothetical protein PHT83_03060 [Bacilli bacterium]|nr:hypothetical protein [Bacilli bacterium]
MNLYYLARMNNNRYKKQTRIFFISVILSSFLFLFFIAISGSVKFMINTVNEENYELKKIEILSSEYFNMATPDGFLETDNLLVENTFLENLVLRPEVDEISVKYHLNRKISNPFSESFKLYFEECEMIVHSIEGVDSKYATFSNFELKNTIEGYEDFDNSIVKGNDFQNSSFKSALIDEYVALKMGYFNLDDVIGKTITIEINGITVEDIQIVGVFSYRLGQSKNLSLTAKPPEIPGYSFPYDAPESFYASSPLIVTKDIIENLAEEDNIRSNYYAGQKKVVVETKSVYDVEPIINLIEQRYPNNDISSTLLDMTEEIETYRNISIFFFIMSSVILLVAIFSIFNSLISKMFIQRKFLKMLLIMGYTIKDIVKVYLIDNLIVLFKSIIVYVLLTYFATLFIESKLKNSYRTLYEDANNIFIARIEVIAIYSFILILITTLIVVLVARKQSIKYAKIAK